MASETIRDVVIKVSIENGSMVLNPPDTSAWMKKIAEAQSVMDRLKADANSVNLAGSSIVSPAYRATVDSVQQGFGSISSQASAHAGINAIRAEFAGTQSMIQQAVAAVRNGRAVGAVGVAQQVASNGPPPFPAYADKTAETVSSGVRKFLDAMSKADPRIAALVASLTLLGIAAAAAYKFLIKIPLVEGRERQQLDARAAAQYGSLSAKANAAIRLGDLDSQHEITSRRPFLGGDQLRGSHIRADLALEGTILERQTQMRGRGEDESRIEQVRDRSESFESIRQQQETEKLRTEHLEKQLKELNSQKDSIPAKLAQVNADFDRSEKAIKSGELKTSQFEEHLSQGAFQTGNWAVEKLGGVSSRMASESRGETAKALEENRKGKLIERDRLNERSLSIAEAIAKTEREQEESIARQNSLTRERLSVGQRILDQERSRTRGEKESFGSMSLAEQEIARQANEKAKRIEKAEKEGRKPTEELTPIELSLAGAFGKTALGRVGSKQKQRRADESGVFADQDEENKSLERQVNEDRRKAKPLTEEVSARLDQLSDDNKKSVDRVVDAIERKFTTKAALEEMAKRIELIETENRNRQIKNRQWTGGSN